MSLDDEDGGRRFVLTARWVVPVSSPPIEGGAVEIAGGRIAAVGRADEVLRSAPRRVRRQDFGDAAILPGLVNTHTHLELTAMRGLLDGLPFPEWLSELTRRKYGSMREADFLLSARWGVVEGLRGGITCFADCGDSGSAASALATEGGRGIVYQEVFGPHPGEWKASLAGLRSKVSDLRRAVAGCPRLRIGISPHSPYTVSPRLFRACTDYALSAGLPMAVHVAESRDEELLLRNGTGAFARRLRDRGIPWKAPARTPLSYLEGLGVFRARPLLIHCVRTGRDELLRARKARVTIAHCPQSNAKLGHGVAPLSLALEAGLDVGLGTDGAVSNDAIDLFSEMKFCSLVHRAAARRPDPVPPQTALELATLRAARALGMGDRIGSLEPGKLADLAVVDFASAGRSPATDPVSAVVFAAGARDVAATYVAGRRLRPSFAPLAADFARLARRMALSAARNGTDQR